MSLSGAIEQVARHEAFIEERPVTGPLMFPDAMTLQAGENAYRLGQPGLARLCARLSAPAEYLGNIDADLRQAVLQRHLERGDLPIEGLTLLARQGELIGLGRSDLLRISGAEVLEAVQQASDRELTVQSLQFREEGIEADLLLENFAAEAGPDDVLRAGLRVTHSFLGDHATVVESYILRLVCRNGLTHRQCAGRGAARTRRLPAGRDKARELQIAQVRRLASETIAALHEKLNVIGGLRHQSVQVEPLLTRWLERARLSARTWMPVLHSAWEAEGSQTTAFGVMNALTRVATHEPRLTARQRRIFGGLAGLLAFERLHLCPRCFSHLGGAATATDAEPI